VTKPVAAIGFLFDRNNLDFVAVHLHGHTDLLPDELIVDFH
jgi:hypothetical protein